MIRRQDYVPLWCKSHFSFLEGASCARRAGGDGARPGPAGRGPHRPGRRLRRAERAHRRTAPRPMGRTA